MAARPGGCHVIWRNGRLVADAARWRPPVRRRGVFTTVGCRDGRPLLWKRHLGRLMNSAVEILGRNAVVLPTEFDLRRLLDATGTTGPARLRVVVTPEGAGAAVEAAVQALAEGFRPPSLRSVAWKPRPAGHKWLDRQPWNDAAQFAAERGADDALLVDGSGTVFETSVANVWVVADGKLATPPAPRRCLPGVLRSWLIDEMDRLPMGVEQREVTLGEVLGADEVWISNAVIGVQPVAILDDRRWSAWPVLERIRSLGIPAPLG
jgi:branched-subunit amino acid aminotransferase/4-amino-4-deoxychorismate lyase